MAKGMMILGSVGSLGVCIASIVNQASSSQVLLRQAESVAEQREESRSSLVDCLGQENDADCSTLAGQYATLDEELLQQESTPAYQNAQSEQNQFKTLYGTMGVVSLLLFMGGYFAHEKRKSEQELQQENDQIRKAISTDIDVHLERIREQNRIYNPQELSTHLDALEEELLKVLDTLFQEALKKRELEKNSSIARFYDEGRKRVQFMIAERKRSLYN